MAVMKDSIEKALCHLFPSGWLNDQAEKTGVIKRNRKVNPIALFWTLVLGIGYGEHRSIASLRRAYEEATGTTLASSSFYDRFTPKLVEFLKRACQRALDQVVCEGEDFKGLLANFKDLLVSDATILRLHDGLENLYPACRTNHTKAACKLHLVYSVLGVSEQRVQLTGERKKESQVCIIKDWVKNCLLLFDLGYFKYALFDRIDTLGGFFISRLKTTCNGKIVTVYQGSETGLIGEKLQYVLLFIRRGILDVEVEVTYPKRKYKGKRSRVKKTFRVIGIKNPLTNTYHLYVTNISPEVLSPQAIARIYSIRWLIELVFKQLKSFYHLEDFPSQNPNIGHALIYSAILTMIVSQTIEQVLRKGAESEKDPSDNETHKDVSPLLRLAAVVNTYCAQLLKAVLRCAGLKPTPQSLTDLIRKEARDPNRRRPTLPEQLQLIALAAA